MAICFLFHVRREISRIDATNLTALAEGAGFTEVKQVHGGGGPRVRYRHTAGAPSS